MHHPTLAAPPADNQALLRHFSGELVAKSAESMNDLHRLTLQLVDDDGASHQVLIAYGRGPDAVRRCAEQYEALTVGARYHGSADVHHVGDDHHWHLGNVTLKPCMRRARFELVREVVA